jgi:hypothetical protein
MAFRLVTPAARSSAMMGASAAALALARAIRALSALFRARWPMWRPVGIIALCQCRVNFFETLSPRGTGRTRAGSDVELRRPRAGSTAASAWRVNQRPSIAGVALVAGAEGAWAAPLMRTVGTIRQGKTPAGYPGPCQPRQHSPHLRRVPLTATGRRDDAASVERHSKAVQARSLQLSRRRPLGGPRGRHGEPSEESC